jgi:hypothetical protein
MSTRTASVSSILETTNNNALSLLFLAIADFRIAKSSTDTIISKVYLHVYCMYDSLISVERHREERRSVGIPSS